MPRKKQTSKPLELLDQFCTRMEKSQEAMGKKIDDVHAKVQATQSTVNNLSTKVAYELSSLKEENSRQNDLLAEQHETLIEHTNRSVQLQRDNELREAQLRKELFLPPDGAIPQLEKKIEKVDAPRKWIKGLLWVIATVSGMAGGAYTVWKFWDKLL